MKKLARQLTRQREAGLYRRRRVVSSPQQTEMVVDGQPMLTFCSNDYLGLANHPEVIAALQQAANEYGVGSGAAHLINGHSSSHHALEEELAEFTGRPRALLYSTGYMANIGVVSALLERHDWLLEDRLNHASLVDAGALTPAKVKRFQHGDPESLARQLDRCEAGQKLIATDGVFSMDGDLAPLDEYQAIALNHDAWLMVDDAHGLGVLGENGGGTLAHFGLGIDQVPILMGTLGKGFGTFGAFVAGSEALIETLIQKSRSYIYTTAMPSAVAEATRVSLRIAQQENWRRQKVAHLIVRFRQAAEAIGLPLMPSADTPIQPLITGCAERALQWSKYLEERGILVSAIRPPTVPDGQARLRITLSANHTDRQLDRLLDALQSLSLEQR
jgi:8-amino-7-oxononanoate synthase